MAIFEVGTFLTSQQLSALVPSGGSVYINDQVSGLRRFSNPWGGGTGVIDGYFGYPGWFDQNMSIQTPGADSETLYQVTYSDANSLTVIYAEVDATFAGPPTTFTIYF